MILPAECRAAIWQLPLRNAYKLVDDVGLQSDIKAIAKKISEWRHLRQNWWKTEWPLSGSDRRKRTFVQKVEQGSEGPVPGGNRPDRFRAAIAGNQPFVHAARQGRMVPSENIRAF
jgi:hypothetical protein